MIERKLHESSHKMLTFTKRMNEFQSGIWTKSLFYNYKNRNNNKEFIDFYSGEN